eukprot:Nitzschia sp. Nitz4//scaffold5_size260463//145637//146341//NITZ4_000988-RA/size260463-augustus-gene-0.34-mRNA-1//-1//CDS//3329555358//6069//frame0
MTIKVEREALITALGASPSWETSHCEASPIAGSVEDCYFMGFPSKPQGLDVASVQLSTCSDEDSCCTSSTSSDSCASEERRVRFASSIVTDEWTRPFTPREEVSNLYYSTEDTNRFRCEYRLERKVLSELSLDPETCPVDDISHLIATTPLGQTSGRHSISRVVVLHNNQLETFCDQSTLEKEQPLSGDFFDNDSFWSGSLTWY